MMASSVASNITTNQSIGPVPGQKYSEITFLIFSLGSSKEDVHFLKYPIYVGGKRARGHIYPDGSNSNNNVYSATTVGILSKNHTKRKRWIQNNRSRCIVWTLSGWYYPPWTWTSCFRRWICPNLSTIYE